MPQSGVAVEHALFQAGHAGRDNVRHPCVRVADACFTLAGGSAVYESSLLQRRMRDLDADAQHATVHQQHYVAVGRGALAQLRRQFDDRLHFTA